MREESVCEEKHVLVSDCFLQIFLFLCFSPSIALWKGPAPVMTITDISPKEACSDFPSSSMVTMVIPKAAMREEAGVRGVCAWELEKWLLERWLNTWICSASASKLFRTLQSYFHVGRTGRQRPQGHKREGAHGVCISEISGRGTRHFPICPWACSKALTKA